MKKSLLLFTLLLLSYVTSNAQGDIKFGLTGGLLNADVNVDLSVLDIFDIGSIGGINNTGFYIGALADIGISDSFHVQPELTYGSAGDLAYIYLPVMAKYYVANKFNIQAGPQFSFSTSTNDIKQAIQDIEGVLGTNTNLDDVLNTVGVEIGFGAGFDILENLSAQARYAFEVTDKYSGPLGSSLDIKGATLNIGVAYFFN